MRALTVSLLLALSSFAALAAAPDDDYDPRGRRDPFQVMLPRATATPASGLERFDLSELRLEGIISGISDPRATVTLPTGESHLVKPGMRLGSSGGRVARITSSEVVVREEWHGEDGITHVRETSLTLAR